MISTIYVDMDDVIVNFTDAAYRLHGRDPAEEREKRPPGFWSMVESMGMMHNHFWTKINKAGKEFWEELEFLPGACELLGTLPLMVGDNWFFLTAGARHPSAYSGKVAWMKKHFGWTFSKFVMTTHKHLLANDSSILIDDREQNIDNFVAAGGHGILFPSLGNRLYDVEDPFAHVLEELNAHFRPEKEETGEVLYNEAEEEWVDEDRPY